MQFKEYGVAFFSSISRLLPFGFLVTLLLPQGAAQTRYKVNDLGTLGGVEIAVTGINDLGQVVGYGTTAQTGATCVGSRFSPPNACFAFRTAPNRQINPLTDSLGTLGGATSSARGINDLGQVVGASLTKTGATHAFRTLPNRVINPAADDLNLHATDYGSAFAVNDLGQVVGSAASAGNFLKAFRTAAQGRITAKTDLGTLGGASSDAIAINSKGQVAGGSSICLNCSIQTDHAFRSTGESSAKPVLDDLGVLAGDVSSAAAINDAGQVAGISSTDATDIPRHAFLTAPNSQIKPTADDLGTLGGSSSTAEGMNNSGQVVGYADTTNNVFPQHAFLYARGRMHDLNTLIPAHSGWVLVDANGINEGGQIAGLGNLNGQVHAYRLDPVGKTLCASDVTKQLTLLPGGLHFDVGMHHAVQKIVISNTSNSAVEGPITIVFSDLAAGVSVVNPVGLTSCSAPSGRPFVLVLTGLDSALRPGAEAAATVQFDDPNGAWITYTAQVLAGKANR